MTRIPTELAKEANIHRAFCQYVKTKYPTVIFTSESAGIRLTMGQAIKAKALRSSRGLPDFWLAQARGGYFGFFLELKRSRDEVLTKKGELKIHGISNKRILEQLDSIEALRDAGYYAAFGLGLKDAIKQLDYYMAYTWTWADFPTGRLECPNYREKTLWI